MGELEMAMANAASTYSSPSDYLIIGGGVAGGHAAFEIRKHDKSGSILVINRERQFPYDRPPLSKEYLAGEKKRAGVFFKADSYYKRNKIGVIRGRDVQTIATESRKVALDDGREFSYKTLLIATGGRVKRLDNLPGSDLGGVFYLRTIEDSDAIKKAASAVKKEKTRKSAPSEVVVVVGGGFIGCEVAATLRTKGLKVTLIHKSPQVLSSAIDEETARWIQDYHTKKGVSVLTGATVTGFAGNGEGDVSHVKLEGHPDIPADFVVVGVGITPDADLAERAGLMVEDGILVDEFLRANGRQGIFAAGDAAKFYSPIFKRNLRVEHVDVAQKQGAVAGANMVSSVRKRKKMKPFDELPYFFSYQYDLEINAYGDLSKRTRVVRRGEMDARTGFIQFYFDGALLSGFLSVNAASSDMEAATKLLQDRREFSDASILSDESKTLKSIAKGVR